MTRLTDLRRTFRDRDGLQAILDEQPHREPNRRVSMSDLAIDSIRMTEAIGRRAAVHHGTTPAQVRDFLRNEDDARVQAEIVDEEVRP